ncbi:hypothetical protein [Bdellovibrio sp. HCB337]|uniref:hypothetical protein n=1 Tax=Bdellovibrio sp. HCB337 TaxID=3394358 RepID=UPI0039A481B6
MNLRQFSMAILISALPLIVDASASTISLNKEDFVAAEKISRNGETLVSVKLSKSGKAKFKKLNKLSQGNEVHSEIGGVSTDFKLREPIQGDSLEMGPYSTGEVDKVITEINNNKR